MYTSPLYTSRLYSGICSAAVVILVTTPSFKALMVLTNGFTGGIPVILNEKHKRCYYTPCSSRTCIFVCLKQPGYLSSAVGYSVFPHDTALLPIDPQYKRQLTIVVPFLSSQLVPRFTLLPVAVPFAGIADGIYHCLNQPLHPT